MNLAAEEHDNPRAAVDHPEPFHDDGQDLKVRVEQPA